MSEELARLRGIEKDHMDDWKRIQDAERKGEELQAENQKLREALERREVFARFFSKVVVKKKNQCWEWTSSISPNGYGKFSMDNYPHSAHRVSFQFFYGSIAKDKVIDHTCMNRKCVNPNHLRAVSYSISNTENTNGMASRHKLKTHCPAGHPYDDENTIITSSGGRKCKICKRAVRKAYYQKHKEALAKFRGENND